MNACGSFGAPLIALLIALALLGAVLAFVLLRGTKAEVAEGEPAQAAA